jgi:hypothetical protein
VKFDADTPVTVALKPTVQEIEAAFVGLLSARTTEVTVGCAAA